MCILVRHCGAWVAEVRRRLQHAAAASRPAAPAAHPQAHLSGLQRSRQRIHHRAEGGRQLTVKTGSLCGWQLLCSVVQQVKDVVWLLPALRLPLRILHLVPVPRLLMLLPMPFLRLHLLLLLHLLHHLILTLLLLHLPLPLRPLACCLLALLSRAFPPVGTLRAALLPAAAAPPLMALMREAADARAPPVPLTLDGMTARAAAPVVIPSVGQAVARLAAGAAAPAVIPSVG